MTEHWLKDKITITLSRDEMFQLASAMTSASYSEVDFTKIRDRRIRKMFRESIMKRHKLWLKITNTAQEA